MQVSNIRLHKRITQALANEPLQTAMGAAKENFTGKRAKSVLTYNQSADFEALREYGKQVRDQTIADMPALLQQFSDNATAAGTTVLWARNSARAAEFIATIARHHAVKSAVKSKSMATEEIALNATLQAAGVEVVETDLGEFIIQLAGESPSHIIAPAVHKSRAEVSDLFAEHLSVQTNDIPTLTAAARAHLRAKFFNADMGISGANFLIADSGSALIVTNEGNGRMTTTLPRVHITLAGIDKVIPRLADLPQLLTLLTHSATGQQMSNYISMTTGARRATGGEGPEHTYIVLLDNGRSRLRHSEYSEMLRCIRCGACMNHCPVYHNIGGHAYGSVYMGPMGQVLTPAMFAGVENTSAAKDTLELPYAATLCGACEVACPVKIPLPKLMRRLRAERVRQQLSSPLDQLFIKAWSFCALRPRLYAFVTQLLLRVAHWRGGSQRRIHVQWGLGSWFNGRDLSIPSRLTFRQIWHKLKQ
ncbi:MAG: lactate utilization protein [Proteobacteria bacterium]|nr:lactate utilization protein [Pseudomonadota bacterium]